MHIKQGNILNIHSREPLEPGLGITALHNDLKAMKMNVHIFHKLFVLEVFCQCGPFSTSKRTMSLQEECDVVYTILIFLQNQICIFVCCYFLPLFLRLLV